MMQNERKVWLIAVNMGYGHQRAAMPLLDLAQDGKIVTANEYTGIPASDEKVWRRSERFYNFISRLKGMWPLGSFAFSLFDRFQGIDPFYPLHDQSSPSLQLRQIMAQIKKGWGRHLIELLLRNPLPIVTTYFVVAHMAEYWNYPAPIYAVVTDSDIPRAWAPPAPAESKIVYLASTERAARRLEYYGVPKERIVTTGFPLFESGYGPREKALKEALKRRLGKLDPQGIFDRAASGLVRQHLGRTEARFGKKDPVSITFAVGGAGAQLETAASAIASLATLVKQKRVALNLVAGVSPEVARKFEKMVKRSNLETSLGTLVKIVRSETKDEYFRVFNELLATTDILWTKPSELSFYPALGIPLLLTEPVGAHEIENRAWLLRLGAAVEPPGPVAAAADWLPELISSGRLAEAALAGFAKMERYGASNIRAAVMKSLP